MKTRSCISLALRGAQQSRVRSSAAAMTYSEKPREKEEGERERAEARGGGIHDYLHGEYETHDYPTFLKSSAREGNMYLFFEGSPSL